MNTVQRKFLVEKLTERTKTTIDLLKKSIPESLSLNVYMLHRVMSNDFEIKSNEELKKLVLEKALAAGQKIQHRDDWLGNSWGNNHKGQVVFTIREFFNVPQEYLDMQEEIEVKKKLVEDEIRTLKTQLENLEIRITMASDKTLQSLINQVDDMGDIALIDTKIKLLSM